MMHVDAKLAAALATAMEAVNNPNLSDAQRKSQETALLAFQQQDAAWSTALSLVDQGQPHDLVLFASQTIRLKVNEQSSSLPAEQLPQLLQQLLQQLAKPHLNTRVLRQLCLAVTTLAALLPSWSEAVEVVQTRLPPLNGAELLTIIAEEAISDWRHVVVPGLSSSQHLDWATATRERFRSWSHPALQVLLSWLQGCRQNSAASGALLAKVLSALTAWVQLGALHHVPQPVAMQVAEAGLLCVQSSNEQELAYSLKLLLEIPEYAPEQLLSSLQPSMCAAADAACRAANAAAPDLVHATAWTQVFAAYAAAVPQHLLQPLDVAGGAVQKALLHLSMLPQVHDGRLVSLPALEVWVSLLDRDISPTSSTSTATGGTANGSRIDLERTHSQGETIGDLRHLPAAFERNCLLLLLYTSSSWLIWQQCRSGREALSSEGAAAVVQGILQMACSVLGPEKYVSAMMAVWSGTQHRQHQQDLQQPDKSDSYAKQQVASRSVLEALHMPGCAPLLEQADYELMPCWQQQQLSEVLVNISLSPACLRLHGAVLMAASSCACRGVAAAAVADGEPDSWADTPAQLQRCDFKGASQLAHLMSVAAAALQQPATAGILPAQQQQLVSNFCVAIKGWARLLVELFISPAMPDGAVHVSGLLQLLLHLAAHDEEAACPAAAAVRAVSSAALKLGWSQLHLFAPLLMQALRAVAFYGGAEQDLLASLSSCLAAPGMEPELELLRQATEQQLLQPGIEFLRGLQQQLQAGTPWASMSKAADAQICHHLIRVRAVLEGRLLLHQRQQKEQQQQQQLEQVLEACSIGNSFEGINQSLRTMHVQDVGATAAAIGLAGRLAAAAMDEDGLEGTVASLRDSSSSPGLGMQQCQSGMQQLQQQDQHSSESAQLGSVDGGAIALVAAAAVTCDPALQLLLSQLWPQLHSLVVQHNAAGRFIHHYSKCCSRLLKLQPALFVLQLQHFLQAAVVGMARPGGCSLAEPFAAAIEVCCMQGSALQLDSRPHIMQALGELWNVQEVAALQQPGRGDAIPDLAEQVLKLYSSFAKHGRVLHTHSAAAGILQQATIAAAGCATCCHRKVGGTALSLLSAVLAAASCQGPQQPQLLEVVCKEGVVIIHGVVGALLAPSPLPRVQRAAAVMLDLAAAVDQMHYSIINHANAAMPAAQSTWQQHRQTWQLQIQSPGEQQQCLIFYKWLLQGTLKYVPNSITEADAAALAADCTAMLCGSSGRSRLDSASRQVQHASRSFITSRKLKKRLRDFAEQHMRAAAGAGHANLI